MSEWALEINDAGLQLIGPNGLAATEPGYAWIDGDQVTLGRAARAQSRLRPRQTLTRFWHELSTEPLGDPAARGYSAAELAALQLAALWNLAREVDYGNGDALLVVPGDFDRAQLGIVLGAARAAEIPVAGLVDSAVAATRHTYPGWQLVHVDIGLHQLRLTHLSQTDGVRRSRFEALPDCGLLALRDRWLRAIAERFIAETRFDPLHDAASEQRLHDQLDVWLAELRKADVLELSLDSARGGRSIELPRRDLLAATDALYQSMVRWIGMRRAPGVPVVLQVGHRLAQLPGVLDALERIEETVLIPCAESAPASGALSRAQAIRRPDRAIALVVQLPTEGAPVVLARPERRARRRPDEGTAASHIVHRGLAHAVGTGTFAIGTDELRPGEGLRLADPDPLTGISRRHCVLFHRDGELILQDQSRYGTYVNAVRVADEIAVQPGDVIRIGSPGIELVVIGVVEPHAA